MRRRLVPVFLAAAAVTCAGGKNGPPIEWREAAPGLAYAKVALAGEDPGDAHLFRADLAKWKPLALDAKAVTGKKRASVQDLAEKGGASIAVNATFFDENGAALGLLRGGGVEHNPLRSADWGVLAVTGSAGTLVHTQEFRKGSTPEFAVQCGPRAVVSGVPPKLKAQAAARRTVLCLTAPDSLVFVATEGRLTAGEIAKWLAAPAASGGLGCTDALLLDGGPSTGMWAKAGAIALDLPAGYPVPNGVGLAPR